MRQLATHGVAWRVKTSKRGPQTHDLEGKPMDLISRTAHGVLDYAVGILLILAPWMLGFTDDATATNVCVALGVAPIAYSLFTDYELGAVRAIPFRAHLAIDTVSGVVLLSSPWLLGFADRIIWPHVSFGILELVVVMLSSKANASQPRRRSTYT